MWELEGVSLEVLYDDSFTLDYGQYYSVIDEDVFRHLWFWHPGSLIREDEGHDEREVSLNNIRDIESPLTNWLVYPLKSSDKELLSFPVLKAVTIPATVRKSGFSVPTFLKFMVVGTNRKGLPVTRSPISIVGCDNAEAVTDCVNQIDDKVQEILLRKEIRIEGA